MLLQVAEAKRQLTYGWMDGIILENLALRSCEKNNTNSKVTLFKYYTGLSKNTAVSNAMNHFTNCQINKHFFSRDSSQLLILQAWYRYRNWHIFVKANGSKGSLYELIHIRQATSIFWSSEYFTVLDEYELIHVVQTS